MKYTTLYLKHDIFALINMTWGLIETIFSTRNSCDISDTSMWLKLTHPHVKRQLNQWNQRIWYFFALERPNRNFLVRTEPKHLVVLPYTNLKKKKKKKKSSSYRQPTTTTSWFLNLLLLFLPFFSSIFFICSAHRLPHCHLFFFLSFFFFFAPSS
jgi:hypothetical protein